MKQLSAALQAIFERNKGEFRRRVGTLEEAVAAINSGSLDEGLRAVAERDAHKLSGSLGTFGLPRGSELAGELEQRLAPAHRPGPGDGAYLVACVRALRRELDGDSAAPGADEDPRGAPSFETGLRHTDPAALASARILVVDDDESVRQVLVLMLSEAGYDVSGVESAREARRALEVDKIALLLSDVNMPGETGLDLIRFALCEHPETATLLISSLEDPGIAQVAMDFGAYGYLSKPVRRSAVLIGVMNALRRRDMEARERAAREHLERTVVLRTRALSDALERVEAAAEQGRVLQGKTIHLWAQAAEYRDPGIGKHVRRMSRYCAILGGRFGLHRESLELASVLHDVGKAAIPDGILLKHGPLTLEERVVLESHPEIGHGMLCDTGSSLLDLAAVIARTHHERFDGSGYPHGLAAEDIPMEGRVAAIADVFDALTSDRVYRSAWSLEKTIAHMRNERGKHFDPRVLDVFLSSMDEMLAIRATLPDE